MLTEIAKHHKEWVLTARKLGADNYAEDIVQEMYLKLDKYSSKEKCFKEGKLVKSYIYLTLRSLVGNYYQKKKGITKVDISCLISSEDENNDEKIEARKILSDKIEAEIDSWHWYDKQIFNIYRNKKTSYRKISKDTDISFVAIFGVIRRCKIKLKANVGEDYLDFINEDFELLK